MQEPLRLNGVHHSARPTWKLRETVEFYRDTLGLPLVHGVSARGWGAAGHPDFLHFFFASGKGSTIAFFYYLGDTQPEHLVHRAAYDSDAAHTAWQVDSSEELQAWRARLEAGGVAIMYQIEHEVIESIYFRDPNGYMLEITRPLREFVPIDARDAELTLQAAIEEEGRLHAAGQQLKKIESVWHAKGKLAGAGDAPAGQGTAPAVSVLVPDIPEFVPLLEAARKVDGCAVRAGADGYWRLEAQQELRFARKALGLGPALWNSALSGGYRGRITRFDRDELHIAGES